ncbi:hypothetical protein [Dendronalium sp. ChiSLP03b]|uniref:hypothetical protein n=1 Tax=Dendronalium sp. ChiSLP03b TaxID=3075381 RepID=UPI00391892BF
MTNLKVDPTRWNEKEKWEGTGIFIRAQFDDETWEVVEISHLDKASLLAWLKSKGGDNRLAENCIGVLLGHGHLHEDKSVSNQRPFGLARGEFEVPDDFDREVVWGDEE